MSTGCKVCDDKAAALTIDRYLEQGLTYSLIARSLTLAGFAVSSTVVSKHNTHRVPSVNPDIKATKRDAAIIIKNKVLDALEVREQTDNFDILERDLQPALKTALAAQTLEDKREQKKTTANFWVQLFTNQQGEMLRIDDGNTLEGQAVDVTDE